VSLVASLLALHRGEWLIRAHSFKCWQARGKGFNGSLNLSSKAFT
jgi:hypothetical protein